jgi:hypothetical protein
LNKPNDNHGVKIDTKLEFDRIRFCELLGQKTVPHFGIYGNTIYTLPTLFYPNYGSINITFIGYEYQWIYPTALFRREF